MCRDDWFSWQCDVCCLEEQQGDRRSIDTVLGSPGFRTDPLRQPDSLDLHSTTIAGLLGGIIGAQFNGTTTPMVIGFVVLGVVGASLIAWTENGKLFGVGEHEPEPAE